MRVLQTEKIGVVVNKRVYAFLKKKEKKEITHSVITSLMRKWGWAKALTIYATLYPMYY